MASTSIQEIKGGWISRKEGGMQSLGKLDAGMTANDACFLITLSLCFSTICKLNYSLNFA